MNKETAKKICTVIVAICAIALIFSLVDMLFSALSTDDALVVTSTDGLEKKVLLLGKWTMLSLCFVLIAAAVISVLNYFSKNKALGFLTGGLYLFIALMAIAFVIAVYVLGKEGMDSSSAYASAVIYCEQYLKVAVATAILGAYYTVCAVQSLKNKDGADGANKKERDCDNGGIGENEECV